MKTPVMTADEYKEWVRSRWTEAEFTREVIALARQHGWRVAHFRAAKTEKGWRTPVQGDGAGFPDLILIREFVLIAAELKVGKNTVTPDQKRWLAAFEMVEGAVLGVTWRPSDWDTITDTLRGAV